MRSVVASLCAQTSADAGISAFPESDNIFNWVGTITGGAQTVCAARATFCGALFTTGFQCATDGAAIAQVYEGLKFKLTLTFPSDYPFKAPTVRFDTQVFHPNVDTAGNICLDILKDKWSAVHNVRTILLSIQSLLGGECLSLKLFAGPL